MTVKRLWGGPTASRHRVTCLTEFGVPCRRPTDENVENCLQCDRHGRQYVQYASGMGLLLGIPPRANRERTAPVEHLAGIPAPAFRFIRPSAPRILSTERATTRFHFVSLHFNDAG